MKIIFGLCLLLSPFFAEELKDENLLQTIPKNFKMGFHNYNKENKVRILEFVPENETVENWSQLITSTITYGNSKLTTSEYTQRIKTMWIKSCPNSAADTIITTTENGYDVSLMYLFCPKSPVTHKAEFTYLKALKGKDAFYSVQKAFAYEPTKETMKETMNYLKFVQLCDTRLGNCPKN